MSKKIFYYAAGAAISIATVTIVLIHQPSHSRTTANLESTAVETSQVAIQNYMFKPMTIKVKAGMKVTWTNKDQVHHSVTADNFNKYAPDGPLIVPDRTYSFTFAKTGTYTFHCMPHPYMHGTVIVTN